VSKYDSAIDKGIALLDAKVPEWCTKMQLDHLKLENPSSCVLGQVFGDYEHGLNTLKINGGADYGFAMSHADYDDIPAYGPLTRRWKQRIRQHCEGHNA